MSVKNFVMACVLTLCACAPVDVSGALDGGDPEVSTQALRLRAGTSSACDQVHCVSTQECVEVAGHARCVLRQYGKDAGIAEPECQIDSDCRLAANYCDGCSCEAVPTVQVQLQNKGCQPVACLIDPCRGLGARCEAGHCSVGAPGEER
jgi:hypothetical protein